MCSGSSPASPCQHNRSLSDPLMDMLQASCEASVADMFTQGPDDASEDADVKNRRAKDDEEVVGVRGEG